MHTPTNKNVDKLPKKKYTKICTATKDHVTLYHKARTYYVTPIEKLKERTMLQLELKYSLTFKNKKNASNNN